MYLRIGMRLRNAAVTDAAGRRTVDGGIVSNCEMLCTNDRSAERSVFCDGDNGQS